MAKQSPVLAPKRLFLQIVALQASYYAVGFVIISLALLLVGVPWSLHYVFSWRDVDAKTSLGWLLALLWLLDAMFSVLAIMLIVGRSKLATDFALTLHGINLVVVSVYSRGLPRSWLWWLLQACSAALTVYAGVWASQWRELRRTFFEDYELVDIDQPAPQEPQTA